MDAESKIIGLETAPLEQTPLQPEGLPPSSLETACLRLHDAQKEYDSLIIGTLVTRKNCHGEIVKCEDRELDIHSARQELDEALARYNQAQAELLWPSTKAM